LEEDDEAGVAQVLPKTVATGKVVVRDGADHRAVADGGRGRFWVTEHGRVPNGFWPAAPKLLWPETANLAAATSMADMMIALAHVPEAQGAFVHSLVGSGSPWPLIHLYKDGSVDSSVTLLGLKILRRTMQPHVLQAKQFSHGGGSQDSPYSVRSAVLANADRNEFTLWSVNRSDRDQELEVRIEGAPPGLRQTGSLRIAHPDSSVGNHLSRARVLIESGGGAVEPIRPGVWLVGLPANSVNAVSFR
jgi:hypothetical protein